MGKISLGHYKTALIAFLIGVTIFSVFKYASSLKETYELTNSVKQIKGELVILESEKQNISQALEQERQLRQKMSAENSALNENLKLNEEKLSNLTASFNYVQSELESIKSQVENLKEQNVLLAKEKADLEARMSQALQERDMLNARLGSVVELKKAIKEVKQKMRSARRISKDKAERRAPSVGNHGFLVKNGKNTYPSRVTIEVITTPVLPDATHESKIESVN